VSSDARSFGMTLLQDQDQQHEPELEGNLLAELIALRADVVRGAEPMIAHFAEGLDADSRETIENFCRYLALRRLDIRSLQRRLMVLGLSSLGRLESRVLPAIDAVIDRLLEHSGQTPSHLPATIEQFFRGEILLDRATDALFGTRHRHRRGRIMVTLPGAAATDPDFILDLVRRGMDVARINCAHDDKAVWAAMARHVRNASEATGRPIRVMMDIAGPKIRTGKMIAGKDVKLQPGDLLRLVAKGDPYLTDNVKVATSVSLPEIVTRLTVGDRVRYDDGKLEGVVERSDGKEAILRVRRTKSGGSKIKPEKGLNLPDTALGLSPLTVKDQSDLASVVEYADILGYSYVSEPQDIDLLEEALATRGLHGKTLGLIAKIEQPKAVHNLPALIAQASRHRHSFGIMIARGDLAAEIGFERVAEMQEEILWLCEAASVPTVWATQVLEDLVKTGMPSRGEMTDAAMAARAECVMLNKGPAVGEAVTLLGHLLSRMDGHIFKKTPTLRALKSW
jgi:pyruvate kinase